MAFDFNDFLRLARRFWPQIKRWIRKQQQQQQQGGAGQQQGQQGYGNQQQAWGGQQQQGGAWGQQQGQSPYGPPSQPAHHYQPTQHFQQNDTQAFGPHHPGHQNQDMINASNAQYTSLRNQAITEGNMMRQAFDRSHQAYSQGNGAQAKELSNEGHQHQMNKDRLNAQAAQWIYNENNKQSPPGTIDLHGLYVQEAIEYTEKAIQGAQAQRMSTLHVIVGKGIHSQGLVAKIKPAIEKLMVHTSNLAAHIDPHNTGQLIVSLDGRQGSRDAGFADQLSGGGDQCTIM